MTFAEATTLTIPDIGIDPSWIAALVGVLNIAVMYWRRSPARSPAPPNPVASAGEPVAGPSPGPSPTPPKQRPELSRVLAGFLLCVGCFLVGDAIVLGHLAIFDVVRTAEYSTFYAGAAGCVALAAAAVARYAPVETKA